MKATNVCRLIVACLVVVGASFASSANLITNGDFQTNDFTGWNTTNAVILPNLAVTTVPPPSPGGTLGAAFAAGALDFDIISQTFATVPGAVYDFSFFYQPVSDPAMTPNNEFIAFFNGVNLYDNKNTISGVITQTFTVSATTNLTTIEFRGRNANGADYLDNVSVTRVPDNGSTALLLGVAFAAIVMLRRARQAKSEVRIKN